MNNIFKDAYFGKAYKTREGKKAIFSRKDGDTFDLETEECYNPVRADGSFLYTKEGYESCTDIVSEWTEEINEKELDELANEYDSTVAHFINNDEGYTINYRIVEAFKAGYRKAKEL